MRKLLWLIAGVCLISTSAFGGTSDLVERITREPGYISEHAEVSGVPDWLAGKPYYSLGRLTIEDTPERSTVVLVIQSTTFGKGILIKENYNGDSVPVAFIDTDGDGKLDAIAYSDGRKLPTALMSLNDSPEIGFIHFHELLDKPLDLS